MRRRLLVLALVVALLSMPSVLASHTMGHRYLVYGRIIGADGMPVQNADVEIRLEKSTGEAFAGIVTKSDCMGDFENWNGSPGPTPPGGGQGQQPGIEQNHFANGTPYIAFHIHDQELSDTYKVHIFVEGENWYEGFHHSVRQTTVRHELTKSVGPRCKNFDAFNNTFSTRVSILSAAEMTTGDVVAKTRNVELTYPDGTTVTGKTDPNGAYFAVKNGTWKANDKLRIHADDISDRSAKVDATALKFHRVDSVNVAGQNVGGAINDFKYVGIALIVVAIMAGLWWAGSRMKSKRQEAQLRSRSQRRRFRKEGGGAPPAP